MNEQTISTRVIVALAIVSLMATWPFFGGPDVMAVTRDVVLGMRPPTDVMIRYSNGADVTAA